MTIDDENSIYVGNLSNDCTEESLRKIFVIYGAIVAVKIHFDRTIGGRHCFGFVTFKNPRSAVNAIKDMNGRKISGRMVRVNEVRPKGGRGYFNRENFRSDSGRNMDWDRVRERGRDSIVHDHDRVRSWDQNNDWSRDRETEYEHPLDHGRIKDRLLDRDRIRDLELNEQERSKSNDRDRICELEHDQDLKRDGKVDKASDQDIDQLSKSCGFHSQPLRRSVSSSHFVKRRSRELSFSFSDDYHDQVKEQLEISIQRQEELQNEISQIEEMLEGKHQSVSELKHKSQKLEDALASAKKLSLQRQMQLNMMQKYLMQVKDYTEKLKTSEHELQSLIDAAMIEVDDGEGAAIENVTLHTNGKA